MLKKEYMPYGDMLREELKRFGKKQIDLARETGLTVVGINRVINRGYGRTSTTDKINAVLDRWEKEKEERK